MLLAPYSALSELPTDPPMISNTRRAMRLAIDGGSLSFEQLEDRCCLALDIQAVANLNQTDLWKEVRQIKAVGEWVYFLATEKSSTVADLWRTDGTSAGTIKLSKLNTSAFENRRMTDVNGVLYFIGFDSAHGQELWKSDGSVAGTRMVRDLTIGTGDTTLSNFVEHNNKLYFTANGQLAVSNGTFAGTMEVVDLLPNVSDGVERITRVNNALFFTAKSGSNPNTTELYRTNGTAIGTIPVAGVDSGRIDSLTNIGGTLYFSHNNRSLWRADANNSIAELVVGPMNGLAYPYELTDVNGLIYFSANGALWKSDRTAGGTSMVKPIGQNLFNLFNMQGTLYFAGGTSLFDSGVELWKSDGTEQGTVMVKDIEPGFYEGYGYSSYPSNFIDWNGQLIFQTTRGIWTSDGSAEGTIPFELGNVDSMTLNRSANPLGELFFARSSLNTFEGGMWKRTSVSSVATAIERPGAGVGDANPTIPVELNGRYYLGANDGITGHELWTLDSRNRMTLVKDIYPGPISSNITNMAKFNGGLVFTATDPVRGRGLFASDGTAEGTRFLAAMDGVIGPFVPVNNTLFFTAFNRLTGQELWKTDGTASGTVMVKDIFPGRIYEPDVGFYPNSSNPRELTNFNGMLYFAATVENERELWKSDGTVEGTVMAVDIFPGEYYYYPYTRIGSNPTGLVAFNGQLYFGARTETGSKLMRSDGTPEGTMGISQPFQSVLSLAIYNSQIYFGAADTVTGAELWRSDGVNQATMVKDINPGPFSSNPGMLTTGNGLLYFTADNGIHGRELWQSNGSAAGTLLVKDIRQGIDPNTNKVFSSDPQSFTPLNGTLFFTADDGRHGRELWRTNGAAGGATLVKDFVPGPSGSSPNNLFVRGQELLFAANSDIGRELWRASSKAPVIELTTAPVDFRENGLPILLARQAELVDVDTPILLGGKLTVSFASPYRSGDQFLIVPSTQISVTQNLVRFGGVVIGTLSRPDDGKSLSVVFNQNASVFNARSLLRAIGFRSISNNPSAAQRAVRFDFSDGEAALAKPQFVRFLVIPVNDAPVINGLASNAEYLRNTNGIFFAAAASLSDIDNRNFSGGLLSIIVSGGEPSRNRLVISNSHYEVDASRNLLRRGVIIGSVNANGGIGLPLRISLNEKATPTVTQELLRSLKFSTQNSGSVADRMLTITLNDGVGGTDSVTQTIKVL